jgi:hypothetical protein
LSLKTWNKSCVPAKFSYHVVAPGHGSVTDKISLKINPLTPISARPEFRPPVESGQITPTMNKLSKRAIASRANGKLSQGPKSAEAKLRSSNNSIRHGLLANCVLIKDESRESFTLLLDQHLEKLNPADQVEYGMVEEMAATIWRMRRLWAIETNLLTDGIAKRTESNPMSRLSGAFSDLSRGTELHLIDRYEARLNRMYQRALKNFHLLRQFSNSDDQPDSGTDPEGLDASPEIHELPNEPRSEQPPIESAGYPTTSTQPIMLKTSAQKVEQASRLPPTGPEVLVTVVTGGPATTGSTGPARATDHQNSRIAKRT